MSIGCEGGIVMATIDEQIKSLEEEIGKTQKNKATNAHIGKLKAKIAALKARKEKAQAHAKSSGGGPGFEVKKSGDASVALVGFPSVGKSSLISQLTEVESEVGNFAFTTLTCKVQLVAKDGPYALIRLRSGQMRKIPQECVATIGEVSNPEHNLAKLGKAGAKRWRGVRPTVRGVAMNPVDHPHGGGEGKTSGGRHPVSPWGTPTKGFKTRSNKRTDHLIIKKRK